MKTFWMVLVTVIVAGGLAGGGTYYYLNKKATDDKNVLQTQINTLNTQITTLNTQLTAATTGSTATTGATAIAGWKTFTSSTYKYSFKYPSTWYLVNGLYNPNSAQRTNKDLWVFMDKNPIASDAYRENTDWVHAYFQVLVTESVFDFNNIKETEKGNTITEPTITGEKALKIVAKQPSAMGGEYYTAIYLNHGSKGYSISCNNSDANGTHDSEIDTVISTLQFTS